MTEKPMPYRSVDEIMFHSLVDPRWLTSYPAACTGDWELFDPPGPHEPRTTYTERAALARHICDQCPMLARCAEFVTELTVDDRRGFTYAGITYNAAGDPNAESNPERTP